MIRYTLSLCLLLSLIGFASIASASYSEVSVASTYNTLFDTDFNSIQDLDNAGFMAEPNSQWTLRDMNTLQIMVMDTSSNADLFLKIVGDNQVKQLIYDPPQWTGGTRGTPLTDPIDIATTFGVSAEDSFELYVNKQLIRPFNARQFIAPDPLDGFLIGYNDNNGWNKGDMDMNEPLIYGKVSPTPIPAAAWLLGSGLIGLIGFRRKTT